MLDETISPGQSGHITDHQTLHERINDLTASTIAFVPAGSITAINVQDAVLEAASEAAAGNHNHAGVYEPAGSVAAHAALPDPHPQYLTAVEGNAAYELAGSVAAHEADTTNIHGIVDTAQLATLDTAQTFTATKTFQAAGAVTVVAATRVTADTVDRWHVRADGKMEWGSGSGAVDINLYRSAANILKTDDSLHVFSPGAGSVVAVIRGAVSQTANLQEWQNSAGAVLADLSSTGLLRLEPGTTESTVIKAIFGSGLTDFRSLFRSFNSYAIQVRQGVGGAGFYIGATAAQDLSLSNSIGDEQARISNAAPLDGETTLLLRRNVGGAFSLQRVSMGAVDSGGAGFKLLRVAN